MKFLQQPKFYNNSKILGWIFKVSPEDLKWTLKLMEYPPKKDDVSIMSSLL